LALIGNILVLIQNYSVVQQKKNPVPMYLINNLATSDLLMAVYLLIIAIADINFTGNEYGPHSELWLSHPMCLIACFLISLSSITTFLVMMIICVDRYICIVFPFTSKKVGTKNAKIAVGIMWMFGIIFSAVPTLFSIQQPGYLRLYTYSSICVPNNYQNFYYRMWMISRLLITVIGWISMFILYIQIFITANISAKGIRKSTTTKNKMLAIRLLLIMLTDAICWIPYYYVNVAGYLTSGKVDPITLQFISILTLPINAAVNPFLYTVT
ncbi:uncharacterized protein TRIADDRAFT_15646, partial [Trichoplax adhaerens]